MKSRIILSLMLIAALAGAIGGATLGGFSDIETSRDNVFETVGLDLKVSDYEGNEYDDPIPIVYDQGSAWPQCSKDQCFDVHNAGNESQTNPIVYLHFKNLTCNWTIPKIPYAYINCTDTGECIVCEAP